MLGLLAVLLTACATTQRDWDRASLANTTDSYQEFLSRHPTGALADTAPLRTEVLYYERAMTTDDTLAWKAYLAQYPKGRFSSEVRSRLEAYAFIHLGARPTLCEPRQYLDSFPDGAHREQVIVIRNSLEGSLGALRRLPNWMPNLKKSEDN